MPAHPAIETVVERIRTDAIGGAADTAKEVVAALAALVRDSDAEDTEVLVNDVHDAVVAVLRVTPSLAPPINALHRILGQMEQALKPRASATEVRQALLNASNGFANWAETALQKVALYGAERIAGGDTVFTYSMSSTVWRILRTAKSQGKAFRVVVTESRPGNEGLWTVDEMLDAGIPVSVSIDANIGELVPQADSVFVGADAISSYGTALCKVGTYPTALVARRHGVPFYIAADTLKFDPTTLLGIPWVIDLLHRHEVIDEEKYPAGLQVIGNIFDITPPELVTAIITELGLLHPAACASIMRQMQLSEFLAELLPAWSRKEL